MLQGMHFAGKAPWQGVTRRTHALSMFLHMLTVTVGIAAHVLGLNTCTADFSLIFVFVFLVAYRRLLWTTMIAGALSE